MKTANPFIPTVALLTVPQRNRRERVKFAVFCVLGAHAFLFLALLIHGYRSDFAVRARSMGGVSDLPTFQSDTLPGPDQSETPKLALAPKAAPTPAVSPANPALAAPGPQVAVAASANSAAVRAESLYTVKSGDTLSQIARLHRTTVETIRAANGLKTDRLAVGMKLKIP